MEKFKSKNIRSYNIYPSNNQDLRGIINIFPNWKPKCEATEENYPEYRCENAITPTESGHYCSKWNIQNAFIDIILEKPLYITNYTVQGSVVTFDWKNMQKWSLYGIDNDNQILVDRVEESNILESSQIITFSVKYSGYFNKFRLTDVEAYEGSGGGSTTLRLGKIDFFGSIFFPIFYSTKYKFNIKNIIQFLFIIIS